MQIRKPNMGDIQAIVEMYADWPVTSKGPMTTDRTIRCIQRWMTRDTEIVWIGVTDDSDAAYGLTRDPTVDIPVGTTAGIIVYLMDQAAHVSTVYELIIHPDLRGCGLFDRFTNAVWAYDIEHFGVEQAEFAIRDSVAPLAHRVALPGKAQASSVSYEPLETEREYSRLPNGLQPAPLRRVAENGEALHVVCQHAPENLK